MCVCVCVFSSSLPCMPISIGQWRVPALPLSCFLYFSPMHTRTPYHAFSPPCPPLCLPSSLLPSTYKTFLHGTYFSLKWHLQQVQVGWGLLGLLSILLAHELRKVGIACALCPHPMPDMPAPSSVEPRCGRTQWSRMGVGSSSLIYIPAIVYITVVLS